jgi:hypothetical protein
MDAMSLGKHIDETKLKKQGKSVRNGLRVVSRPPNASKITIQIVNKMSDGK